MVFSDTSNSLGLYQDARFLVQADTNAFPIADFTRLANHWYFQAFSWIMESQADWQWDDSNLTDFPEATSTLVDDQHDYSFPASLNQLLKVAVLDTAGNYHYLRRIDETERSQPLEEAYDTKGMPAFYDLVGNSVKVYPAPDTTNSVTASAGLKLWFNRDFDQFAANDTTQEPGFKPEAAHRILSVGAALDYARARGYEAKVTNGLQQTLDTLEKSLKKFHAQRDKSRGVRIKTRFRRPI